MSTKSIPRVVLQEHGIPNAFEYSNLECPGGWSLENFKKNFEVKIIKQSSDKRELEFDIIGCVPALANAFRRILLSEVPSMAIEKVFIANNTSLIQDEVLAHRLGLLPLKADPRFFEYPAGTEITEDEVNANEALKYELKITCTFNPTAPKGSKRTNDIYRNDNVYSGDIKWIPIGDQGTMGEEQFGLVEKDILLCKMRPGQKIDVTMIAVKGIGKDHAKFSPVATASYRLMPQIHLNTPIIGEQAELLKSCFSPGVIELIKNKKGEVEAKVKDARYDSCSRNVFRHESIKNYVELSRIPNHFIFTIETVGALPPKVLFLEAVKVLKGKCRTFLEDLDRIN